MAAAITTTSTTLEAQLLEIAGNVQVTEAAQSTADVELNNCQIDYDLEAGTVSISVILPITVAMNAGKLEMSASEYLA
jgi:DUF4097 and DUF4098 domain-containing protein YvlB